MIIYAVGDEQDSFFRQIINANTGYGTTAGFRSPGQRGNVQAQGKGPALLKWATAVDEVWVSLFLGANTASSSVYPIINASDSSASETSFQLRASTSSSFTVWRNISGTLTQVGGLIPTTADYRSASSPLPIAVQFKRGSSGAIRVYLSKTLVFEATGDFSTTPNGVDTVAFRGTAVDSTTVWRFARMVVADGPVWDQDLDTLQPNGDGAVTQWAAGGHTRLSADGPTGANSGLGTFNPYNPIFTNASGQKQLNTFEDTSAVPAGLEIYGVQLAAIGSRDVSATPSAVNLLARHAGTDYTLNNMNLTAGDGYISAQQFLYTNPAGGSWNNSDIDAIQFGVTT